MNHSFLDALSFNLFIPILITDSPARVCEEAPRPYTSSAKIEEVFEALKLSKRPLVILGKGSAYSQAETEINKLLHKLKVPTLPTPMGKGIVDDDSEICIAAARST